MKKTIIALATAAVFATSANAATVYEKDGAKVEVGGAVRVLLSKEKDKRADLINDESRLEIKASQDLGNGLSALGGLEIRFEDTDSSNSFGSPTTHQLYAGFDYEGIGTLTFGKQTTNGDDIEINENTYTWGGNNNLTTDADKSIKFRSAEWSGFSFGLDYLFGNAIKKDSAPNPSVEEYKYGYQASIFYTRELVKDLNFNLAAGYGVDTYDFDSTKKSSELKSWRVASQLAYGPVTFGAEYGQSINKVRDIKAATGKYLLVSSSFQVAEPSKVYVQWMNTRSKMHLGELVPYPLNPNYAVWIHPNAKAEENTYLVGVDYQLHKNVVTYLEYAHSVTKNKNNAQLYDIYSGKLTGPVYPSKVTVRDNKVGVGLRVFF
ncbi:OmpH porin-like protein [Pasteurella multocida]|nr:OmpH porin-like protein [Pasteurella multocida]